MPRRERWSVIGDVLSAIDDQHREAGTKARVTKVAIRTNLAYDRLQEYLVELSAAGFVTNAEMPRLTPRGEEFLRQYRAWTQFLAEVGIHKTNPDPW
ncbi:MAG: winged helix-turn-helix domain-containing protein [Methanobacteriota archaeon]